MKRTLSLVLALVMVLGSFTSVFAAEQTVAEKAGAFLKEVGVLVGDASGDLMLEDGLARQDAVVLVAKLMGEIEVAQKFPTSETSPTYKDIKDNFYLPLLAWAQANKTFEGHSDARFGFGDNLTAQEYAKVLLVVLGYEVGADKDIKWEDVLVKAEELGLLADIDADADFLRGQMAVMTLNALGTKMNGSEETLADKLNIELPAPELSTDIEITSAKAIANNKVEVKVKEEVAASVADFTIVKKGTTTEVEIKDVVKESATVFVLETEALVGGTAYTVTSNGETINFTGLAADTTAPTVIKVSATDTNTFVVEYSDRMDFASATNVENYTFNKDIKVVKATLNTDRTKVTIVTDAAKRNTVYTLTIQNVLNSDGKVITKVSRTLTATEDRIAPRVTTLKVQNNRMLEVKFSDNKGMAKASIEALENYTINDLDIVSAKGYKNSDGLYDTVILMTEEQTANKAYTLTMENLTDASVLANPLGKTSRAFRGATADKTSPTVKPGSILSENNNLVDIEFNDNNAMDVASLENIENYVITYGNNEVLPILSAEAWYTTYPNAYKYKGVTLTTAQQEIGTNYRLEVKGVEDEFGNALKPISGSTYAKYNFQGSKVDTQPPYVTKVEYVDSTKVILHFDNAVTNATDPTSYVLDKNIGAAIKARVIAGTGNKQVELTTQALTDNVTYTITINNVQDRFGNELSNVKVKFVATASALDVTAPSMTYIYAANDQEIHVNLDERVTAQPSSIVVKKVDGNGEFTTDHPITFNYSGKINGATTIVYKSTSKLASANYKIETMVGDNFTDVAGNKLVGYASSTVPAVDTRDVFYGNGVTNVAPEVEYIEQINTKTLKVVFNEPVAGTAPVGYTLDNDPTYDSHLTEWYLVKATNFVVGQELTLNFSGMKDLAELGSTDKAYKFTPYLEDTTKPMIVGVEATNNKEVVVEYSEDLANSGTYRIYYLDAKNNSIHVFTGGGVVDDNTVIITLNNVLKGENIYYIDLLSGATDIAGNREDVSGVRFDFPGTDVNVTDFITGVAINNAKKITVSATKAISLATVYELDANGNRVLNLNDTETAGYLNLSRSVTLDVPVLAGVKYEVEVKFVDNSTEKYKFNGITPDTGIELTRINSTTVELNWSGFNSDLYTYGVYAVPAAAAGSTVGAAIPATFTDATPVTPENPFDGTVRFTGANSSYYVVLFDKDDTTRVMFAAKVNVVNSPSYEEAVGKRPNYTINFATSETNEPIEATDFTSTNGNTWIAGNGLKLPLTPGTTVYFAKSNTPAIDEIQTLVVPPVPVGPVFTIDYLAGTTKEVVPTTVEYSTDGTTWTAGTGVALALTPGTNVDFRTKATASAFESATATLAVKAAPSITTYTIGADGKTVELIPNTVEYKVGAGEWTTGASAKVDLPIGTAVQFRKRATATDFAGAVQTLTAAYAAAPTTVALAAGTTNGATVTTDVTLPAVGETDATGKVTGWATGTADAIKFTVTDAAGATSTITINDTSYTSGADYTIAATGTLTIVVTTTQAGAVTAVRTFTVTVE